jgi:hypothetical protein
MPGTFTFKPVEANLTHNTELLFKMSPYCAFYAGNERISNQVCKKGGKHPHWNDSVVLPLQNESTISVEVMDKDKITHDDAIGGCTIDLREIENRGHLSKWYPLTYKNKPAGEILLESYFEPANLSYGQPNFVPTETVTTTQPVIATTTQSTSLHQEELLRREELLREEERLRQEELLRQQKLSQSSYQHTIPVHEHGSHVFIEQRQVVEPHTFSKPVDVVETRAVMKEIEVMEPHKVMKEVQYTECVPVKKTIEVVEPQVVMKEVEVMEPTLVTKEIQVVENVPVKKFVEVIESRTTLKEVDSFEPQSFTKTVEVTEQVPVKKMVTVSEPVTVTKTVDFVEPIITTKTTTKELLEPVVVDERITQSVGPATFVGYEERTYVSDKFSQMRISEEQRIVEKQRIAEEQRHLEQGQLLEQERLKASNLGSQVGGYNTTTYTTSQQIGGSNLANQAAGYSSNYQSGSQQMGGGSMENKQYSSIQQSGTQKTEEYLMNQNVDAGAPESFSGKFEPTYASRHKKF